MKNDLFFKAAAKAHSSWFFKFLKWLAIVCVWGALALTAVVIWFGYDLPPIEEITRLNREPHILIKDRNGIILGSYGTFYSRSIELDKLKPHVVQALLATEDRRFFYHWGIDPIGTGRALLRNISARGVVQGGSTITQQLARNFFENKKLYTYKDRSLKHKIQEALLAIRLEMHFTKQEILTMYLNRVYLGANATGLDAASVRYFGHSAYDLTLYEAAILVGMLKGPSRYSPVANYERSESRAKRVLENMVEEGFITKEDAATAMALPSPLEVSKEQQFMCRYFADWIMSCLPEVLPNIQEDIEIITTIDTNIQNIAQKEAVKVMRARGNKVHASQLALMCANKDGEILAMLGGVDYHKSAYNRATQAKRQPGSSFKFFTFLAALEEGYTPNSKISDYAMEIGGWKASNYKHKAQGEVSVRTGFAKSINAVTVRLAASIGLKRVLRLAKKLGVTSPLPQNYSVVLGSGEVSLLELTGAYLVTLTEGHPKEPYGIRKILNKQGKVLYEHHTEASEACVSGEAVDEMRSIMESVLEYGTGRRAKLEDALHEQHVCGGKTGTSQRYRDVWFIGFVDDIMTGIWLGNDNERPMKKPEDGWPTLYMWKAFNQRLLKYLKDPKAEDWGKEDPEPQVATANPNETEAQNEDEASEEEEDGDDEEEEEEDEDEEDDTIEEHKESGKKSTSSNAMSPPQAVQKKPVAPEVEEKMIKDLLSDIVP